MWSLPYRTMSAMLVSLIINTTLLNTTTNTSTVTALVDPPTVLIQADQLAAPFIAAVLQGYKLTTPNVTFDLTITTDLDAKQALQLNQIDIAVYIGSPTVQDMLAYPDTVFRPVMASGVAPIYNLPNMPPQFVLALRASTMAKIFSGQITTWSDPLIAADNVGFTLPSQPIHVIWINGTYSTNRMFCYSMSEIDTVFASTVGDGSDYACNFSAVSYANYTATTGFLDNNFMVQSMPYAISYSSAEACQRLGTTYGNMINHANQTVSLNFNTLTVSAIEKGIFIDGTAYDFSHGMSRAAYPIAAPVSFAYNVQQTRTTCESKNGMLDLMTAFLQNSAGIQSLSDTLAILPPVITSVAGLPDIGNVVVYCSGVAQYVVDIGPGIFAGTNSLGAYQSNSLNFYQTVNQLRVYEFTQADQLQAIDQVMNGEVSVAVISPDYLNAVSGDYRQHIADNDLTVLPAATIAASIIFSLPNEVLALTDEDTFANELFGPTAVPSVSGLALDVITISAIFTGNINDWTHPNISQYTPWLLERIAYLQQIDAALALPITLVTCCSDPNDPMDTLQVVAQGLYDQMSSIYLPDPNQYVPAEFNRRTQIANVQSRWQVPFAWTTNYTQLQQNINVQMVMSEAQLQEAVSLTDSSISYFFSTSAVIDVTSQASIVRRNADGTLGISTSSIESQLACVPRSTSVSNFNEYSLQSSSVYVAPDCYPFTRLISFAVLQSYNASTAMDVTTANMTLNMLQWLLRTVELQSVANSTGVALLNLKPRFNAKVIEALQYVQCNGMNCLITLPTYWSLNNGVVAFGYTIATIGFVVFLLTSAVIWWFRRRVVIRSASVMFLELMLLGMTLLLLSVVMLVQPPTLATCSAFAWLANFGLQLTFVPLFLKMYRIYKIFSRKQLKIVKITDLKLLSYAAVLLAFDATIMAAWQAESPLQPVTTHVYAGVNDTQYLQCNVVNASYVTVMGVEKACLLLFGCVMSFSTRKVAGTFNESTSVAWSIYNTILATVIFIPIIAFVGALGDTLTILVILIAVWISTSTYIFVFGTKVYTLMQGEIAEGVSQLESNRTLTGGFSFVSVHALSKQTINHYLRALEQHHKEVKLKAAELAGASMTGNAITGNDVDASRTPNTTQPSVKLSYAGDTASVKAPGMYTRGSTDQTSGIDSTGHVVTNASSLPTQTRRVGKHGGTSAAKYSISNNNLFTHETIAPIRRDARPSFVDRINSPVRSSHGSTDNDSTLPNQIETDKDGPIPSNRHVSG